MTILTFPPEIGLRSLQLELVANTAVYTSPFTRATQAQELPGARWMVDAELSTMNGYELRVWRAFRAQLRGSAGRFYFRVPGRVGGSSVSTFRRLSADSLSFTVDSTLITADMTSLDGGSNPVYAPGMTPPTFPATTISTSGWRSGAGSYTALLAGDMFSVDLADGGRAMAVVVEPVVVANDGTASITFEPPMRSAPVEGAAINYRTPSAIFRLTDDKQGATRLFPGIYADSAVSFMESF